MEAYLAVSHFINWKEHSILEQAKALAAGKSDSVQIAKACFEFVRDEIKHSSDFKLNPVTCLASNVLKYRTGYCYAKSHLLAALLRANGIPTALCYQRLCITDVPPYCLHGLNAIYLKEFGWYRVDARGNKKNVSAQFCPPTEKLAFELIHEGELDLVKRWAEPRPEVIEVLTKQADYIGVLKHLPDISLEAAILENTRP